MTLSSTQLKQIAHQWVDAINSGNVEALDNIVAPDVVDHSGLTAGHGEGCYGYKQLVQQLLDSLPGYSSQVDSIEVQGDLVTIRQTGKAPPPAHFSAMLAPDAAGVDTAGEMEFKVTSVVRVDDNGKIAEHWAAEGPFGQKSTPDDWHPGPPPTGSPEANKVFMQTYVRNVIDAMTAENARYYMADNFYNHDPAPGEKHGVEGAIAFISSIFAAFSEFHTTIEEQLAEADIVVGRWSQNFVNTGPYLGFPASGKQIHIGGITITRVRDNRILEEWEARDALSLLNQMGIPSPFGALEGDTEPGTTDPKELARRFFYEVWDSGDLAVADTIFAPDFANNSTVAGQRPGVAGVKQLVRAFRTGFPDCSVSVDLQTGEGDRVATRYTFRGTHRGTFRGLKATGKPVEVSGISIHSVADGKITGHWGFFDDASLLFQLGLVQYPEPGPGPTPEPGPWGTAGTAGR
ncbi:ester cyclase family protein [Amycolatopsis sp. NPDC021455]|uniref:ester cyclase family protein n=1 Tax=Amycolatopsis sp. NPDC021455 TaxID=3154901 RepID=UPI0033EDBBF1